MTECKVVGNGVGFVTFEHKEEMEEAIAVRDGFVDITPCATETVSYCLGTRAGCFLALGSGLRLVGTASARR